MARQRPSMPVHLLTPRFLVSSRLVRDLLLCAKDLFVAAKVTIAPCQSEPCPRLQPLELPRPPRRAARVPPRALRQEPREHPRAARGPEAGEEGVVTKDDLERDPTACRRSWRRRTDPCSTSATAARGWRA